MTFWVMLAVLGSAFLHALWNSLIKVGASRLGAMVILSIGEVPIGLAVLAVLAYIMIRTPIQNCGRPDEPAPPTAIR